MLGLVKGEFSNSQREGIISLFSKRTKTLFFEKNWRPLSLLNIDYKILAKCFANTIKKHIDNIVHTDQTGFIKGRFIRVNINKILSIMEHCESNNIEAMIVNIDFVKAFDSIEWSHLNRTLAFFNFGNNIRYWIKTLYKKSISKLLNNGWISAPIFHSRGLRQGSPLSSILFILVEETLANKIITNVDIKGISVNNQEHEICQYADDTNSLIMFEETSLKNLIMTLEKFENISGLKVNTEKTEIMKIGSARHNTNTFLPHYLLSLY